ncbi:MAG: hypothetical protein K8T90_16605 [Planctomycetes bacterium]|nr:hypothetical protein [Planctomycetota bacterium]
MLRMRNKYCSNCLSTQRFLDLGSCLVCERCTKRLERVAERDGAEVTMAAAIADRRAVAWARLAGDDGAEELREAC